MLHFILLCRYHIFHKLKICGNPALSDDGLHFLAIKFFFFFWLHWVFIAVRRLSLVAASGGYSSLRCTGSRCAGFSSCSTWASVVAVRGLSNCGMQALERLGFRSCSTRASVVVAHGL